MDERTGEQAGGLVDEWMDGWMDGWMDEWTDISLILVLYCSVILQLIFFLSYFSADCGSLPEPTHGHVHYSHGHHFESIATYSCDIHFELSSPKTRVCQASGQWSDCAPTCEPIGKPYQMSP